MTRDLRTKMLQGGECCCSFSHDTGDGECSWSLYHDTGGGDSTIGEEISSEDFAHVGKLNAVQC